MCVSHWRWVVLFRVVYGRLILWAWLFHGHHSFRLLPGCKTVCYDVRPVSMYPLSHRRQFSRTTYQEAAASFVDDAVSVGMQWQSGKSRSGAEVRLPGSHFLPVAPGPSLIPPLFQCSVVTCSPCPRDTRLCFQSFKGAPGLSLSPDQVSLLPQKDIATVFRLPDNTGSCVHLYASNLFMSQSLFA